MFANELRRVALAAARVELPAVSVALWKAVSAGSVTETEAEELSALIEARRAVPVVATPHSPGRGAGGPERGRGSRPRTDASLERRRRWAASGWLPPALAARFTAGELAVLAVVASQPGARCSLSHGHVAAIAGVSVSTVKRAVRAARLAGLVEVTIRRVSAFRNDTNVVVVVSADWKVWLSRRGEARGGGVQGGAGTNTRVSEKVRSGAVGGLSTGRSPPTRSMRRWAGRDHH